MTVKGQVGALLGAATLFPAGWFAGGKSKPKEEPSVEVIPQEDTILVDGHRSVEDLMFPGDAQWGDGQGFEVVDPCIDNPGGVGCPCIGNEDCDSGYCGGVSFCAYAITPEPMDLTAFKSPANSCVQGAPGSGGLGGTSFGQNGQNGQSGLFGETNF